MRLLFFLASFELHKDGVADYTLLLAEECSKHGHVIAVLAWNDTFIEEGYLESESLSNASILRLSSQLTISQKKAQGRSFIKDFAPDVVSVQMVCFGFHPRGWIFGLGSAFKSILPQHVPVQIMFHELWLGLATNHPFKEKMYGILQRWAIQQFWQMLHPMSVHVSNAVYYSKLLQYRLPVRYLPLPSNVPIEKGSSQEEFWTQMPFPKEQREKVMVLLFFGTLHAGWNPKDFWEKMKILAGGKILCAVSAGGQGYGHTLWNSMLQEFNGSIQFVKMGFLSVERLSALLQFVDAGISTTPLSLLGKSGSAMAMIEHGLPIIVTRNELCFDFPLQKVEEQYPHVYMWDELKSFEQLKRSPLQINRIGGIAAKFLKDITLPT